MFCRALRVPFELRAVVVASCLAAGFAGAQVPPQPEGAEDGARAAAKDLVSEGQRRLAHARELSERGAKDEALAELLWCFDRCRGERAFWPTRLGAVLDAWGALAKIHPPARAELEKRRDAGDRAVRAGALNNDDVAELLALDDVLDDGAAALRTYDELVRRHGADELAFFYEGVREEMWRQRRYRTLVEGRRHPEERLQTAIIALREASKRLVGRALRPDPRFAAGVLADVCLDIEARIGLGDLSGARMLVTAVEQFLPGPQTQARVLAHAMRAGDEAFVRSLRAEVERDLNADGKAELVRAIETVKDELRLRSKVGTG